MSTSGSSGLGQYNGLINTIPSSYIGNVGASRSYKTIAIVIGIIILFASIIIIIFAAIRKRCKNNTPQTMNTPCSGCVSEPDWLIISLCLFVIIPISIGFILIGINYI
ncbi:MAG: hypothetical protein Solumvirus2_29 [Solumvirus sp.]|uniref:Uncharacterized protein n=1 Tax=Solumvirus sp. TaxID=2487773 RepID=A0A3G5AGC5_9VIRU|nr:MAG: hypothetical protein Solumvirus2_29 [Solumvirus sp.]